MGIDGGDGDFSAHAFPVTVGRTSEMWKKDFKSRSSILKTSERKKLKETLLRQYPDLSPLALDQLLPSKGDSVTSSKVQGTYTIIYSVDNDPVFFDVDSRNTIYPTGTSKLICLVCPTCLTSISCLFNSIRPMEASTIHALFADSSTSLSIHCSRR